LIAALPTTESAKASRPSRVAFFAPKPPVVHADRVLRIQGYADLQRVRPVIRRTADEMAELASRLSEPAVAYRYVAVRGLRSDGVELDGGVELHCDAFARFLEGCTEVAPFVLTAGAKLSQKVVDLIECGDLLEGVLLETAGWLAIEDATRQFKTHLREETLVRKHRITSRLGPGYSYKNGKGMCTWPLEEQPVLFSLFGESALPVSLMRSCAMQPKMSRSGMFGIGPVACAVAASRRIGTKSPITYRSKSQ
jgi:hypothetical protein